MPPASGCPVRAGDIIRLALVLGMMACGQSVTAVPGPDEARPRPAPTSSASPASSGPRTAGEAPVRHRITRDLTIVIDARAARLEGAALVAVNDNLVRTPSDSMRCIADGLVGVDAETDRWSFRQTLCRGSQLVVERLTFSMPRPGQAVRLLTFEVTCIDRFAPSQDGVTARLSPEDFGTLLFEDVDLAQLTTLVKEPACH